MTNAKNVLHERRGLMVIVGAWTYVFPIFLKRRCNTFFRKCKLGAVAHVDLTYATCAARLPTIRSVVEITKTRAPANAIACVHARFAGFHHVYTLLMHVPFFTSLILLSFKVFAPFSMNIWYSTFHGALCRYAKWRVPQSCRECVLVVS